MKESINNEIAPILVPVSVDYLKKLEVSKTKIGKDIDDNYNQSIDLDKMKKEINDKEHKAKALKSYLPLFEKKLNELLERFMVEQEFGMRVNLEEDFELTFYKNNKAVDIFGMSNGQKGLINLAVTFSFLYLLEVKHQNPFNHIFIDEILDSSLNSQVLHVMDYLNELSASKNITVISHNSHLLEYPHFDKTLNVFKDGQFSKYVID